MTDNPRSLDSLGQKMWATKNYIGMVTWGFSRDWSTRNPWSYNQVSLPYVGISRRNHKTMKSVFITLGPLMVSNNWIKS